MNKLLIIGLVGIVAIGGIWALTKGGNSDTGEAGAETAQSGDVPATFSGSVEQLLALGKNVTCTFAQNDSGSNVNGTVYVAAKGEMVRGDFTMSAQGQTMSGSVIRKDGTNYSWGETPFGAFATKVKVDEPKSKKGDSVDFDESMDYSCSLWKVDNSKFALPSHVNFDDINAEVQQIDAAMEQVNDLKCAACDSVPDANAKAQCKAALGC